MPLSPTAQDVQTQLTAYGRQIEVSWSRRILQSQSTSRAWSHRMPYLLALPAILTGKYVEPAERHSPTHEVRNLFTLLEGTHDLRITESYIPFCPSTSASRMTTSRLGEVRYPRSRDGTLGRRQRAGDLRGSAGRRHANAAPDPTVGSRALIGPEGDQRRAPGRTKNWKLGR